MHAPESDIDFVIYGTENFRLVEEAIARLVNYCKIKLHYRQPVGSCKKIPGKIPGQNLHV